MEEPTTYIEAVKLGTLIIKTLQEYLCIRSIQALAKQPETFSWSLLFDSLLIFSPTAGPAFFALEPSPLSDTPRQALQLDCLKMNNTQIEEQIF